LKIVNHCFFNKHTELFTLLENLNKISCLLDLLNFFYYVVVATQLTS